MFLRIYRGTVPSEYSEERVPRNIPRKMSLGIIRGNSSVGIFLSIDVYMSKTHRSMNVRGNIPTKFSLGIFRGHFRQNNGPRNFLGNLFPRNSVGKFRGISDERRNSEELFPTTCFVVERLASSTGIRSGSSRAFGPGVLLTALAPVHNRPEESINFVSELRTPPPAG
ncbi:hypothetical protein F2Q69_00057747 [Brassica cretica]|uniref:Uncharacterized protein n=1 Tax=Brassica cretica TaxID=69181 RepID=A0A8S9MVH2_BRACR|nr:hypothetical protein F2Q69_00057747 [Brassica cretica]